MRNKYLRTEVIMVLCAAAALLLVAPVFANGVSEKTEKTDKRHGGKSALVIQTDFGVKDSAVASMKGVAFSVSPRLPIFDLTHEIPAFNIWEGAYRLDQTFDFWPEGTVFVSVVDPGVGTERNSIVARTSDNKFVVTPDNGTLTLIADEVGISEVRVIDEELNRLPGSYDSYTFHGRDLYAYTGARLAAGRITFEEVGPLLGKGITRLPYQQARIDGESISGTIPVLDVQYGNVWSNISQDLFEQFGAEKGTTYGVEIYKEDALVYSGDVPYVNTFGDVPEGDPLLYLNSQLTVSIALNYDDFAGTHGVSSGAEWKFVVTKQ